MEAFYIGLHHPAVAWPFLNAMISVNALAKRQSGFRVNNWIMDSGSFSQIERFGRHTFTPEEYLAEIKRFSVCGRLVAAVCQDWMCEPMIVEKTGLTVEEHQARTIANYQRLRQDSDVLILPVLQGFSPQDYVNHVRGYGNLLTLGAWVGVGSICKRNGNPDAVEDVLLAIKSERGDLRLHGFGIKIQALERPTIRELLFSSDSMAWSIANRYEIGNGHDPRLALSYAARIQDLIKRPCMIQDQLFQWWV